MCYFVTAFVTFVVKGKYIKHKVTQSKTQSNARDLRTLIGTNE